MKMIVVWDIAPRSLVQFGWRLSSGLSSASYTAQHPRGQSYSKYEVIFIFNSNNNVNDDDDDNDNNNNNNNRTVVLIAKLLQMGEGNPGIAKSALFSFVTIRYKSTLNMEFVL
jgi:hypothetical protein